MSGPKPALGGPIALVEDGDEILVDLNTNEINCTPLNDPAVAAARKAAWNKAVADNGGFHPSLPAAESRLLQRARHMAVPAVRGAGLHPNRTVWVRDPREAVRYGVPAPKQVPHLTAPAMPPCHGRCHGRCPMGALPPSRGSRATPPGIFLQG